MSDEEELRIVATLDDRATAGLAALSQRLQALGSGPQAAGMQGLQQQADDLGASFQAMSGVAERASAGMRTVQLTIQNLGSGAQAAAMEGMRRRANETSESMEHLKTAVGGFSIAAAAIPAAIGGMAASFAASGITAFVDRVNQLGRASRAAGEDAAQFKSNIDTLRTAGISEQEAQSQLQRFADTQVELAQRGSRAYQSIINDVEVVPGQNRRAAQQEMMRFLDEVAVLPSEQALNRVRERTDQIYSGTFAAAREAARRRGATDDEAEAHARRSASNSARHWASQFGVPAMPEVRTPFTRRSEEERQRARDREQRTQPVRERLDAIGTAWSDARNNFTAAFIPPETQTALKDVEAVIREIGKSFETAEFKQAALEGVKAFATGMRQAHTAVTAVAGYIRTINENIGPFNAFMQNPGGQTLLGVFNQITQKVPTLEPALAPVKTFLENPSRALVGYVEEVGRQLPLLQPALDPVKRFIENPSDSLLTLFQNAETQFPVLSGAIAPFKGFLERPPQNLLDAIKRIDTEAIGPLVTRIQNELKSFFENPPQVFARMVTRFNEQFPNISRALDPIRTFLQHPPAALSRMLDGMKQALANLLPQWAQRWLGLGGGQQQPAATQAAPADGQPTPQGDAELVARSLDRSAPPLSVEELDRLAALPPEELERLYREDDARRRTTQQQQPLPQRSAEPPGRVFDLRTGNIDLSRLFQSHRSAEPPMAAPAVVPDAARLEAARRAAVDADAQQQAAQRATETAQLALRQMAGEPWPGTAGVNAQDSALLNQMAGQPQPAPQALDADAQDRALLNQMSGAPVPAPVTAPPQAAPPGTPRGVSAQDLALLRQMAGAPQPGAQVVPDTAALDRQALAQMAGEVARNATEQQAAAPVPAPVPAPPQPVAPESAQRSVIDWRTGNVDLSQLFQHRQEGGPVNQGQPYLVGERGAELMVPQASGTIVPNSAIGGEARFVDGAALLEAIRTAQADQVATSASGFPPGFPGGIPAEFFAGAATGPTAPAVLAQNMDMSASATMLDANNLGPLIDVLDSDRSQQVDVSGTGRISVDVRAPEGTRVNASGEGLFRTVEVSRMTQMLRAETGPVAATGVNAGTGTLGAV